MDKMLNSQETLNIYNRTILSLTGLEPSSHGKSTKLNQQNFVSVNDWFPEGETLENNNCDDVSNCSRAKAYLIAYIALSGNEIPASGIPTSDGKYLHLDKAKIASFLNFGILSLDNRVFTLTDEGRNYLLG